MTGAQPGPAQALYELIARRASCRSFLAKEIDPAALERILQAGCQSPSSGGFQNLSIIKVTDPQKRRALAACSRGQTFVAAAPVSLVLCIDYHRMAQVIEREPAPFRETAQFKHLWLSLLDAAICAQTMVLAAEAEGLASCYNGNIINVVDQVSRLLALPPRVCPAVMLTLGYPKVRRRQPPKYPASLLVHENEYQPRDGGEVYRAYRRQNAYRKTPPRPERVEQCCQLAARLHGKEYARAVRQDIERKGYLGPYQYWFGCWYRNQKNFLTNRGYREYFEKQGFEWLSEEKGE